MSLPPARVYVSGPYTNGDPCVNTHAAIEAGNDVLELGAAPFVPHLSHFWHTVTPRDYEDWMRIDLAFVEVCDFVLRLQGESPGADRECELARSKGIQVCHDLSHLKHCLLAREYEHASAVMQS